MAIADYLYASASKTYSTASSNTVAITAGPDDVLVLYFFAEQDNTLAGNANISVSSVTDTDGLTWTQRNGSSWQNSSAGLRCCAEVWWAKKTTSGSTTITVTTNVSIDDANIDVIAVGNAIDPDAPWCTDASLPGVQVDNSGSTITPSVTVSTEAGALMLQFSGSNLSRPAATGYTQIATHQNTGGASAARSQLSAKEEPSPLSSVAVSGSGTGVNLAWFVDAINVDRSTDTNSFTNLGGSGPRRSVFSIASTLPIASGSSTRPMTLTINGIITSSGKPFMTTGTAASGKTLEFDVLGIPRIITGYRWYQVAPVSPIEFAFEGYNGSTWDTLSTNVMGGAGGTTPRVVLFDNTTAYSKYRLRETAGTWNDSNIMQVEFKISGHADECGNRTSTITPSTTLTAAASPLDINNLIDGDYSQNTTGSWWPAATQDPTGKEIKFQFATPRLIKYARIECAGYTGNQGSWKWQGSPDGSTWTDIGSAFTWSMTSDGTTPVQDLSSNTIAYSYYRMLGQSGTIIDDPFYQEMYFDIVDVSEIDLAADLTDDSQMSVAMYFPVDLAADLIDDSRMTVELSLSEIVSLAADLIDDSQMSIDLDIPRVNLAASLLDDSRMTVNLTAPHAFLVAEMSDGSKLRVKLTHRFELAADIVDGSSMSVSLHMATPMHLVAGLVDDSRMTAALANIVGKGPFHFAWVNPDETQFVSGIMARDDEDVFSFSMSQNEGDFASLSVVIRNPRIGLLNPSRKKWAWLSYVKSDGEVKPLFFGRLLGIPNNLFDTQITIEFTARPEDFAAQKASLAAILRVPPFFDPIFVSPDMWEDDDVVLETRSANWHIDRVTHLVTTSDTIVPEDGVIELQETDHFRDGLQVQLQSPPVRSVVVTCDIPWTQSASGVVSLSHLLTRAWPRNGDSPSFNYPNFISSFTFQGLQDSWPKPGSKFGKSWTVLNGELVEVTYLAVVDAPILPSYIEPTQLVGRVSTGSIILDPALALKYYTLPGQEGTYINWVYNFQAELGTLPVTVVTRGWGKVVLDLQYNPSRSFTESVTIAMDTSVQSVVTEPGDDEFLALNVTCNPVSSVTRDGTIPIGNLARRSFCDTPRGVQAVEYLTLLARANLIDKSRVVNTTVDMADFEQAMDVTLRKGLLVHDRRLPGGQAVGKITGYVLSFADGVAKASVSITSAIGYGDAVTETDGDPTYVEDDYVDEDYQIHVNGISLLPSGDVGISIPEINPNDDGWDFIKGIQDTEIVTSIAVENSAPGQANSIYDPTLYPYGQFGDPAEADSQLQKFPTRVHVVMKQLGDGPFVTGVDVACTSLVLPKQIDLEAESA